MRCDSPARLSRGANLEVANDCIVQAFARYRATRVEAETETDALVGMVYSQADLSELACVDRLMAVTREAFDGPDVVVNNAVIRHFSPIEQFSDADIDAMASSRGISREEATREYMKERQPSRRFVRLEDVGAMIAFLCGPAGRDITGTVIPIDGGDGGWSAA